MPPRKKKDETVIKSKEKYNEFDIRGLPHVGPATYEKLSSAGFLTVFDVLIRGSRELSDLAPLPDTHISDIVARSHDIVSKSGFARPANLDLFALEKYRELLPKIKIRCDELDRILKGGIEREALTEIYGENGVGKTQIFHTLVIEAIEQFGMDVVFIDVEDTLDMGRLIEIAINRGYVSDEREAREKYFPHVIHKVCPNTDIITMEVDRLPEIMLEKKPKLILLDGVIGQFRAEYLGRGTLSIRQQNLNKFLHQISNIAHFFSCAVVYTNQVQADPSVPAFVNPIKPIGGNIVGHASKYRLNLQKRGSKRVARLEKSSKSAIEEVYYAITEKGIVNA